MAIIIVLTDRLAVGATMMDTPQAHGVHGLPTKPHSSCCTQGLQVQLEPSRFMTAPAEKRVLLKNKKKKGRKKMKKKEEEQGGGGKEEGEVEEETEDEKKDE